MASSAIAAGGGAAHSGTATPGSSSSSSLPASSSSSLPASSSSSLPASSPLLGFVSAEAFVTPSSRNFQFVKSLVDFLDRNHKQGYASTLRTMVKLTSRSTPELNPILFGTCGFYLLVKDKTIVAVAQLDASTTITSITVPKAERGKGYARMLLRVIAEWYAKNDLCIFSPTYLTHERLLQSAGWTRYNDVLCPDGTVDLMPEHSKRRYGVSMTREDKSIYPSEGGMPTELLTLVAMNHKLLRACDHLKVPKK